MSGIEEVKIVHLQKLISFKHIRYGGKQIRYIKILENITLMLPLLMGHRNSLQFQSSNDIISTNLNQNADMLSKKNKGTHLHELLSYESGTYM